MDQHGPDPSLLRWMNAVSAIHQLRSSGEMTSTELAKALQVARSTAEEALGVLTEKGLVDELPPATPRRAGRPARRYRFRNEAGYVVGVGFDHLQVSATIGDLSGETIMRHARQLPDDTNAVDPVAEIVDTVNEAFSIAGRRVDRLRGIAVGLPGVISPDGRIVRCDPAPSWVGRAVSDELAQQFNCPAMTENHGRMAVLGECWQGLSAGSSDVVFIIGGVSMGVGVMVNGDVVRGRHGAAGEVGHHPLLSGSVVLRLRSMLAETSPGVAPEQAAARAFAAGDDPAHTEFRRRYAEDLAALASMAALTVDPEYVILGGTLAEADDDLVEQVRHHIEANAMFPPTVARTSLGEDAIAIGGVRRALTLAEQTLLDPVALSRTSA